ncbi:MAG: FKBP-type peptidyl-prolyl cis-trans isomerase [Gemmataceae bacterium]
MKDRLLIGALLLGLTALGGCGKGDEPGMKTLDSGLKYRDIREGAGEPAKKGDSVSVVYTGRLRSGKQFDANDVDDPFTFELGKKVVIKGWDEGLVGMKIGGTRKLIVPPDLAYGDREIPGIPANSELIFEVELLDINGSKEPKLTIKDIKEGEGRAAKAGDTVEVHYTGKLADGTKFDSSRDRDKPFEFRLGAGKVIKGWDRGVVGMKVGGKRELVIPPELGYGKRGTPTIPPNAELYFEVELLRFR